MMQALYDRIGITGHTALVERLVNEAKDRVLTSAKWPFLEQTTTVEVVPDTRSYALGTDVAHILAIYDSTGKSVEPVERTTYDRIYRGDTATAAIPTVYTREHFATTAVPNIHFWKAPTATATLTLNFMIKVPDLTNAGSTGSFAQIPANLTIVITQAAEAALHEWESSSQAPALEAKYQDTLAKIAAAYAAPVIDDGTR